MRFVDIPAAEMAATGVVLRVAVAQPAGDYRLNIVFSDGENRTVDFGPFLRKSHHPAVREYLDPTRFADFVIRHGDLMWGDYDLIFPLADLYAGRIS